VDFGIARTPESDLTVTGQTLGTPEYSPPELLPNNPKAASQCTDNYALGVILYELLTGKVAFNFRNAQGGMNAEIVSAFLANPMEAILDFRLRLQEEEAIPQEVRDLVFKAMDPEPQARFQTFVEFKRSSDSLISRFINT
jgi:serine/threonine protein kinase